jgi:tetratricopeptide (TPR) repeat protein
MSLKKILLIVLTLILAEISLYAQNAKDSDSLIIFYKTGLAYQEALKYDSSSLAFGNALKIDSSNVAVLLSAGNNYEMLGLQDESLKCYMKIASADSGNAAAIRALAKLYYGQEIFDSAQVYYTKLLRNDSTNSFINRQVGYCCLKQGQLQKSISYLLKAYYPSETDLMALAQLTINYLALKQPSEAHKYALIGINKKPKSELFNKLMGDVAYFEKDYQNAAIFFYKAYQLGDRSAHCLQKMGISLYSYADKTDSINFNQKIFYYSQAIDALKKSAIADSTDVITFYFMGQAHKKVYNNRDAVACYDKVISLVIPSFMCDLYMNKADCNSYLIKYREAISDYESAYFYKPSRVEILAQMGLLYEMKLNDIGAAKKYYTRYLSNFDENTSDPSALEIRERMKIINNK